jgi:hypothetical protein
LINGGSVDQTGQDFTVAVSEVSAFNHAFRRWGGQSPGDYRRHRVVRFKSATAKQSDDA